MPNYKLRGEFDDNMCIELANIPLKYGFRDIQHSLYKRTRELTADDYISLVGTYSHTIAMSEDVRKGFLSELHDVIFKHAGMIKSFDTIDLQLARK